MAGPESSWIKCDPGREMGVIVTPRIEEIAPRHANYQALFLHDLRSAPTPGVFRHRGRADLAGVVESRWPSARLYLRPAARKLERRAYSLRAGRPSRRGVSWHDLGDRI